MIRTVFTALTALVATILCGTPVIFIAAFGSTSRAIDWCTRTWGRAILFAAGVKLSVENAERLAGDRRYIVIANHHSYLDIPCLLATIPQSLRFFAKASLFRIPLFGWAIQLAGFIPIDRKNRRSAVQSFDLAAQRVRSGNTIVVFPEEGRSRTLELKPFQRGGFLLAIKSGLPILPVAIDGTFNVLPVGASRVRPGPVVVRIGEPVDTEHLSVKAREELSTATRQTIRTMLFGERAQQEPVDDPTPSAAGA